MSDARDSDSKPSGRTRRSFLKAGLLGGAGAVLGFPLVRVGMWWNRNPGEGLKALSGDEFRIVEAMAEAIIPPGGVVPESAKDLNVAFFVDAQIASMNEDLQRVMKAALHAIEDVSALEGYGIAPFCERSLDERIEILRAWETSSAYPKRGLVRVYKWYIAMGYCETPGVLDAMGVHYLCNA